MARLIYLHHITAYICLQTITGSSCLGYAAWIRLESLAKHLPGNPNPKCPYTFLRQIPINSLNSGQRALLANEIFDDSNHFCKVSDVCTYIQVQQDAYKGLWVLSNCMILKLWNQRIQCNEIQRQFSLQLNMHDIGSMVRCSSKSSCKIEAAGNLHAPSE